MLCSVLPVCIHNIAESIQSQVVAAYKMFHCVGYSGMFTSWPHMVSLRVVRTHTDLPVQRKRKTAIVTSLSNKITSFWTLCTPYADTIFVYYEPNIYTHISLNFWIQLSLLIIFSIVSIVCLFVGSKSIFRFPINAIDMKKYWND